MAPAFEPTHDGLLPLELEIRLVEVARVLGEGVRAENIWGQRHERYV